MGGIGMGRWGAGRRAAAALLAAAAVGAWAASAAAAAAAGRPGKAAGAAPVPRERIEWCDIWIPGANDARLPRVLLVGDSIVKGYYAGVEKELAGKVHLARLATSRCVGDPVLLAELRLVLEQYRFDVIHFNNGLHGWGFTEAEYRAHFPALLATLRKHGRGARLVWASTTPIRAAGRPEQLDPRTERVRERNRIARERVERAGIPVNDLFALAAEHPEFHASDGIHFNSAGNAALAERVAASLRERLR